MRRIMTSQDVIHLVFEYCEFAFEIPSPTWTRSTGDLVCFEWNSVVIAERGTYSCRKR
jgi:hypothetical protein